MPREERSSAHSDFPSASELSANRPGDDPDAGSREKRRVKRLHIRMKSSALRDERNFVWWSPFAAAFITAVFLTVFGRFLGCWRQTRDLEGTDVRRLMEDEALRGDSTQGNTPGRLSASICLYEGTISQHGAGQPRQRTKHAEIPPTQPSSSASLSTVPPREAPVADDAVSDLADLLGDMSMATSRAGQLHLRLRRLEKEASSSNAQHAVLEEQRRQAYVEGRRSHARALAMNMRTIARTGREAAQKAARLRSLLERERSKRQQRRARARAGVLATRRGLWASQGHSQLRQESSPSDSAAVETDTG
ncbi:putative transmembrane protein [Toxoplasma gondii TgCatPRC2]|uniref:Putative transmembrane protein n=1 Tax=Toxoplasma gondii TgCatPRC2 TaxID=1130821 RepID=A0A151HQ21_TOXGO|nr:putative transmembrane protein [Toxoplasma gondii TgCatPRC2]